MNRATWLAAPLLFMLAFFVGPLLGLLAVSLTTGFPLTITPSLATYAEALLDSYYLGYIGTTLLFGATVTLLCLLLGYPFAYFMARFAGTSYDVLLLAVISPLLVGVVVRTVGWTILFGTEGFLNQALRGIGLTTAPLQILYTPFAAVVGMVHVLLPFMVLSIISVLAGLNRSLEEAARSLGAGGLRVFLRVTLPLSMRGVSVGCVLVFALSIGAYLTPVLLGGGRIRLLSPLIYEEINSLVDWSLGATLSMVLLVAGVGVVASVPWLVARRRST
jgi:putative spermidine/putrescine transport system permease protein